MNLNVAMKLALILITLAIKIAVNTCYKNYLISSKLMTGKPG